MANYRHAIIGTGRPHGTPGATGFGMAHSHLPGFQRSGRVDLVAISDIDVDTGRVFLDKYDLDVPIYPDYREMLAKERIDVVSVCLWPHLHADAVVAAAEAGVKAIHCEKPMALTWGDAKRMKAAADANGAILTFNHQRRFLPVFQTAKRMLSEGAIGEKTRIEAECGDLFDWGTHWFDMMFWFNGDVSAEWAIGQIDVREEKRIFGALVDGQGVVHWKWKNGVRGSMITGYEMKIGCAIRIFGTEGVMELPWSPHVVRVWAKGDADWRAVEAPSLGTEIDMACADLIKALDEPGYKPLLSADNAIQSTEIIFATFHSSRKHGRADLPLDADDSGLLDLVARGEIVPIPA